MEPWQHLFSCALQYLDNTPIETTEWRFGGGTVLMLYYNHRLSKDVDIFFHDPQFLPYVSPRVNDALGTEIGDYDEQSDHLRIVLEWGKIDFIVAPTLTGLPPEERIIQGRRVYLDDPTEIILKKIAYRYEEFKPRDIFDMAVVLANNPEGLSGAREHIAPLASFLMERIERLESAGLVRSGLDQLDILAQGKPMIADCAAACLGFLRQLENDGG